MVLVLWNSGFKNCGSGERMMIRLFTILLFSILVVSCTTRKLTKKETAIVSKCRDDWEYLNLQDTISGEVLYHEKASFLCGILATASSTIIKTTLNDTIRVLWLCNRDINFRKSEIVKIFPAQKPSFAVSPPVQTNPFDCTIKNTYFGTIELLSSTNGVP
jgi:hypothetical protein